MAAPVRGVGAAQPLGAADGRRRRADVVRTDDRVERQPEQCAEVVAAEETRAVVRQPPLVRPSAQAPRPSAWRRGNVGRLPGSLRAREHRTTARDVESPHAARTAPRSPCRHSARRARTDRSTQATHQCRHPTPVGGLRSIGGMPNRRRRSRTVTPDPAVHLITRTRRRPRRPNGRRGRQPTELSVSDRDVPDREPSDQAPPDSFSRSAASCSSLASEPPDSRPVRRRPATSSWCDARRPRPRPPPRPRRPCGSARCAARSASGPRRTPSPRPRAGDSKPSCHSPVSTSKPSG